MSKEVKRYELSTSEGGRAYIQDLFRTDLRRRDFDKYISQTLAADFACALSRHLSSCADAHEALLAERDALQAFANEIVSGAFEGGSFDGGDIQDIGVKHGLLRIEQRDDECGEACACREYGFPSECYRKTELLGFAALQGAQP